jgi:hypothetical protein
MPKVSITPKITVDAFVREKLKSNPDGLALPIFRRYNLSTETEVFLLKICRVELMIYCEWR